MEYLNSKNINRREQETHPKQYGQNNQQKFIHSKRNKMIKDLASSKVRVRTCTLICQLSHVFIILCATFMSLQIYSS